MFKRDFVFNFYSEGVLIVDRESLKRKPELLAEIIDYIDSTFHVKIHSEKILLPSEIIQTHSDAREYIESTSTSTSKSDAQSDFNRLIEIGVQHNSSDIHITINKNTTDIIYRINGALIHNVPGVPQLEAGRAYAMLSAAVNYDAGDGGSEQFDKVSVLSRNLTNVSVMLNDSSGGKTKKETVNLRIEKNAPHEKDVTKTVIRILRNSNASSSIRELGIDNEDIDIINHFVQQEQGSIIISGPTSSGKSSTLHAFVNQIPKSKSVLTIEDPVELPSDKTHVVQYDISKFTSDDREKARDPNVAYDSYIKSALRQDPNVIMIGEIRDHNVAERFIRSAYTGHLVLSTLHTNDAMSIIPRLVDLGISPFVLAQKKVMNLLMSQRLVPTLCPNCKRRASDDKLIKEAVLKSDHAEQLLNIYIFNEQGCKSCNYTGNVGRRLVYEYIVVDSNGRAFIEKEDFVGWTKGLKSMNWKSMQDRVWKMVVDGYVCPLQADERIGDVIYDTNLNYDYEKGFV
jgi:type II secretory ATPase GspE/PulE/Tfp pilus assembly ATPase PilB-like protein